MVAKATTHTASVFVVVVKVRGEIVPQCAWTVHFEGHVVILGSLGRNRHSTTRSRANLKTHNCAAFFLECMCMASVSNLEECRSLAMHFSFLSGRVFNAVHVLSMKPQRNAKCRRPGLISDETSQIVTPNISIKTVTIYHKGKSLS